MDETRDLGAGLSPAAGSPLSPVAEAYLSLLRRCITRDVVEQPYARAASRSGKVKPWLLEGAQRLLARRGLAIVRHDEVTREDRAEGVGWPASAETMIGLRRLEGMQRTLVELARGGVPGDFFEAGCWRGGGGIFMLGVLKALGDEARSVWLADSFQGYPAPTENSHEIDRLLHARGDFFSVTRREVEANVRRYELWGPQARLLAGWFGESIPRAPIERVAYLRIDVDGYEGVRDALRLLYPKMPIGGVVQIEDVRQPGARRAMDELFRDLGRTEDVSPIPAKEPMGVSWRKTR